MANATPGAFAARRRPEGRDAPQAEPALPEGLADEDPRLLLLTATFRRLIPIEARRLALIADFIQQVAEVHDPDAVETFLRWKDDPVLDTILLLAARLGEDDRDELLDVAEDLARRCGAVSPGDNGRSGRKRAA